MPKVLLMEFDLKERNFKSLKEIDLSSVPTKGDKITLDFDGIGYVFDTYEVHYSDNLATEVLLIRLSTVTNYFSSKFNDIK